MRWAVLAVALAACDPETGTVHDGDTDIILTAQSVSGDCRWDRPVDVLWEAPEGLVSFALSICVADNGSSGAVPTPECWPQPETIESIDEDGYFRWTCPANEPWYTWHIDYTAPRP